MIPKIAIVGRANVGKSTLFNRLLGANKALTSPIPGTTRDRAEGDCFWNGTVARVIDTGGVNMKAIDPFDRDIREQAELAINECDLVLFLVDVKVGINPDDRMIAKRLRESKKPIILVGNKADTPALRRTVESGEWKALALGTPFAIAAHQGQAVGDLLEDVWKKLKKAKRPPVPVSEVATTRVMVIGTPNVGKSTLLNAIVGQKRFITSPVAHTTREPNDTLIEVPMKDGGTKRYIFVDTAGIRSMAGVKKRGGMELAGVMKTLKLLPHVDVAILVLDVLGEIGNQEKKIIELLSESNTATMIVANKWDLVPNKETTTQNDYLRHVAAKIPFFTYAPIVFTSALTGQHVQKLLDVVDHVQDERYKQIDEDTLNEFLKRMIKKHLPSRHKGVSHPVVLKFHQTSVAPPVFALTIKGKRADVLHPSYLRFLENQLREEFGFDGTPIRMRSRTELRKT